MGRPERKDVDYFPFYVKEGRTLFVLENKYGCQGTGFFTNLFRFLSRTPDHHFSIATESDKLYFFASVKCDSDEGMDMIELMVTTGKLDKQLWEEKQVLASSDFLDSINDAYRRRSGKCIRIDEIRAFFNITTDINKVSTVINPQSKVKETKSKDTKVKKDTDTPPPDEKKLFLDCVKLTDHEYELLVKCYGKDRTDKGIQKLNDYYMIDPKTRLKKPQQHYYCFRSWVIKEVDKDISMEARNGQHKKDFGKHDRGGKGEALHGSTPGRMSPAEAKAKFGVCSDDRPYKTEEF